MSESPQGNKLGPEVILTVILYGSSSRDPSDIEERFSNAIEQRRLELQLRPRIPIESAGSMESKTRWMDRFLKELGIDVKHSRNWRCEFCGMCW
jgi:hypothetical protein